MLCIYRVGYRGRETGQAIGKKRLNHFGLLPENVFQNSDFTFLPVGHSAFLAQFEP